MKAIEPSQRAGEQPSDLADLARALASDDAEARRDAVEQVASVVSESFGAEGALLGAELRELGVVARLAQLLSDSYAEVRVHALLALGNLCSDSVDPRSRDTKAMCLNLGMEAPLMSCISDSEPSVLLVACATLQNLCHDAAWASRMVEAGVEARLEALLHDQDARLVRYASGALKNLTLASRSTGGPAPQLSSRASDAVRQRELEASIERFMRGRACRTIARAVGSMAPQRLERLLRVHPDMRGVPWLDAVSDVHAALSDAIMRSEAQPLAADQAEPSAQVSQLRAQLSLAAAAYEDALGPPEMIPPEMLEEACDEAGVDSDAEEVEEEEREEHSKGAAGSETSQHGTTERAGAGADSARSRLCGSSSTVSLGGGAKPVEEETLPAAAPEVVAGAAEAAEVEEALVGETPGADDSASSQLQPSAAASSGNSQAVHRHPQIPPEANRAAAEEWLARAKQLHEAGDDAAALRHCEKSLRLCESAAARALAEHLRRYGPGSAAAAAVTKVLQAADHYEVLGLGRPTTEAEVKKAYKKLSLQLHPDRNHARRAEAAFQRLGEAHTALFAQCVATEAPHTPRPPPRPDSWESPDSSGPRAPRSHDSNPVRRRRWEKALSWMKRSPVALFSNASPVRAAFAPRTT